MIAKRTGICHCGNTEARRYMNGWLCAEHAPNTPTPDPTRTADALRANAAATRRQAPATAEHGPCGRCRETTVRYGPNGTMLCPACRDDLVS
jgi:hypothetical protein